MTTPTLDEQIMLSEYRAMAAKCRGDEQGVKKEEAILASLRELAAIKSAQEEAGHEIGLWPISAVSAVAKLKAELAAIDKERGK